MQRRNKKPPSFEKRPVPCEGILLFCLLAVSPLMAARGLVDYSNLPKDAMVQSICTLLLISAAIELWKTKTFHWISSSMMRPALLYPLSMALSLALAISPMEGLPVLIRWLSGLLLFFLVSRWNRPECLLNLWIPLSLGGGLAAAVGLAQYLWGLSWFPQEVSPASTFANKNMAAQYLIIALPFSLYPVAARKKGLGLFVGLSCLGAMGIMLAVSKTKAAWLGVTLALAIWGRRPFLRPQPAKGRQANRSGSLLVLIIPAVLFLVNSELVDGRTPALRPMNDPAASNQGPHGMRDPLLIPISRSLGERLPYWANTISIIREHPILGVGPGNFKIHYPLYHRSLMRDKRFSPEIQLDNVHNDILQITAEGGALALLIFIWLLVECARMLKRGLSMENRPEERLMISCCGASITALLVDSLFSFPLQVALPPVYLFILMGTVSALCGGDQARSQPKTMRIPTSVALPVLTIAVSSGLAVVYYQASSLRADALYYEAYENLGKKKWEKALLLSGKARSILPWKADLDYLSARALDHLGRDEEAISLYGRYLKHRPYSINALFNQGKVYLELGRIDEGVQAIRKVLKIYPDYPEALNNLAAGLIARGRDEEALQSLLRAIALKPDYPEAHNNLGSLYGRMGLLQKALEHFRRYLETGGEPRIGLLQMGRIYTALGMWRKAAEQFERLVSIAPRIKEGWANLAVLYGRLKEYDKAAEALKRLLELDPKGRGEKTEGP